MYELMKGTNWHGKMSLPAQPQPPGASHAPQAPDGSPFFCPVEAAVLAGVLFKSSS